MARDSEIQKDSEIQRLIKNSKNLFRKEFGAYMHKIITKAAKASDDKLSA